jgi:hypothetical protein
MDGATGLAILDDARRGKPIMGLIDLWQFSHRSQSPAGILPISFAPELLILRLG